MAKEQEVASADRLAAEGGIASDESAVTEPEITRAESSEEIFELGLDEEAIWEGEYGDAGCPIEMDTDVDLIIRICGRKLHAASNGSDEQPVCLMHTKDPN
ncbi:MAG TPA: hypothetical protein VKF63_03330, partial [Terracidiphilus sp.]|nr:hypothetical protein [Terracidiphilus sp.]